MTYSTEAIGREIRAELARQGKTAGQLAETVGMSVSQMSRRMRGRADFTLRELLAIADILDVPLSALITRSGADGLRSAS